MDIYCTRPHCDQPLNSFSDLDNSQLLKTVHQRHCSNCGMPLILDGRYLPIKLLQQGGLGVAFLGCDRRTPGLKRCVIKQLQINASFNTTQLEIATKLFHREAEVLEKLGEHPRIPRLFAFLELTASASPPYNQQKFFYLVQEYIEGQNLQEELRDKGKLSEAEVIVVLRETAKILEFIHFQDTIHRDVKPSNIMRDLQGKIHLIDFGAVKQVVSETLLKTAVTHQNITCVFTPEYAPAEQRQGQAIYPSSDLYALAVTCLNLLTGKQPQQLLDPSTNHWKWRTADVQVSDALAAILDQMLENAPGSRFPSARDVLDALEASWGGQTMSITPSKIQATSSITPTTMLAVAIDNNFPQVNQGSVAPDTALPNRSQSQSQTRPVANINNVTSLGTSSVRTSIESDRSSEIVIQRSTDNNKPWLIAGVFVTGVTGLIAMTIPPLWGHFHPAQVDPIASRSSTGEKILVSVEGTKDTDKFKELKRAGVNAISNHNYPDAVIKLQAALAENPNSPETRIYLNNALVGDKKSYTIAAVAPISSRSADRAAEMLRGFAQAQDEINQAGNVSDPKIKIKIIDDADDPKIVEKIATALVTQPEILGVVGHNRNDVTMKASVVYNAKKLSFIAPISTANQLTGSNKPYIFRTNAKGDLIAQKLVDQLVDKDLKKKVVIFYVPTISYNDEFKTQFTNKLVAKGGQVVGTFPFSRWSSSPSPTSTASPTASPTSPTVTPTVFNAAAHLQKAKAMGAEAILILSVGRSNREALKILKIRANKYPELEAFSDTAMYGVATLEAGKEADGLVMGVPWQESQSTPQFSTSARQLWNNQVNWATATSYNAVKALGAAIKNEEQPSRESVMKTLSKGEFMGASRKFQFTNGEPTDQYALVKVSPTPPNYKFSSRTGRDFVPLE